MARKVCLDANIQLFGWCNEQCEDKLVISTWYDIEGRIDPVERWPAEQFRDHFFVHGSPLSFTTLIRINTERKRIGLVPLVIRETDVFDYGRMGVTLKSKKAQLRCQLREDFLGMDTLARLRWTQQARVEMRDLPPPHRTYAEYRAIRDPREHLNDVEHINRREVVNFMLQNKVDTGRLEKQLEAASCLPDCEPMIAQLVAKLSSDQALDLLDKFSHVGVKSALLRRSMEE